MGSASRFDRRSPISSSLARGRPISQALTRISPRPRRERGADAAGLATSWPGPVYRKYAECGRSTRTRRSAGLRPWMGRLPPIMGWFGETS